MSPQQLPSALSLRQFYVRGVNTLMLKWAPYHAAAANSRILNTPSHPLYEQSKRRWDSRTDSLWWNCLISTKVGGNKKVVRGWLSKRAKVAFSKALKAKGYTTDGAKFRKESGEDCEGNLVGSLQFYVLPEMLSTGWEDLCKQTELIVAAIEHKQIEDSAILQRGSQLSKKERKIWATNQGSQKNVISSTRRSL